jgi:acetyl-CoA synthetase (ADP-forming)
VRRTSQVSQSLHLEFFLYRSISDFLEDRQVFAIPGGKSLDHSLRKIDHLFSPRAVAVVGASESFAKWGFGIFNQVLGGKGEFQVYPVNRNAGEVFGVKAYPKVNDIPGDVDLAIIVIPPEHVPAAIGDCVEKGVKAALVITAGFREIGPEGAVLESEMIRIAKRGGIRLVGPNCNGHFDTGSKLFTTGPREIKPGPISLISQSGNFGGFIVYQAVERGIGFNKYVSSGNEADLTIEDYLEYLGQDEKTRIICAYVEGLKDGKRFIRLAKEITKRKPIIMMKVGRTPEGASAALSHTGSLSGSALVHNAALRQSGVITVERVDQMLDVASALVRQPLPQGRRVGIVTAGGGFGVVATDACRSLGLEVPPLSGETIDRLSRFMPSRWSHANPVDMAGDPYLSIPTLGTMLKTDDVDAVLAVSCLGYTPQSPEEVAANVRQKFVQFQNQMVEGEKALMDGLLERMKRYNKPLIIAAVGDPKRAGAIAKLIDNDIYPYRTPEDGARVIAYLVRYGAYLKKSV